MADLDGIDLQILIQFELQRLIISIVLIIINRNSTSDANNIKEIAIITRFKKICY